MAVSRKARGEIAFDAKTEPCQASSSGVIWTPHGPSIGRGSAAVAQDCPCTSAIASGCRPVSGASQATPRFPPCRPARRFRRCDRRSHHLLVHRRDQFVVGGSRIARPGCHLVNDAVKLRPGESRCPFGARVHEHDHRLTGDEDVIARHVYLREVRGVGGFALMSDAPSGIS